MKRFLMTAIAVAADRDRLRSAGGFQFWRRPAVRHHSRLRSARGFRQLRRQSPGHIRRNHDQARRLYRHSHAEQTMSQLVLTPAGSLSVFGFKTPVPYPFGVERTGYLVTDLDAAVHAAQADGADVLVTPFNDPIGKDAVIQWPGGVNMQLYWHTTPPSYPPLKTIPENRVYVSADRATAFVQELSRVFPRQNRLRRRARARNRDRAGLRYLSAHPDIFSLRRDGRSRYRWASSVSVWPRDDRVRGREPGRHAGKGQGRRRVGPGRSQYRRPTGLGNGPIPGRLHRRDPFRERGKVGCMRTAFVWIFALATAVPAALRTDRPGQRIRRSGSHLQPAARKRRLEFSERPFASPGFLGSRSNISRWAAKAGSSPSAARPAKLSSRSATTIGESRTYTNTFFLERYMLHTDWHLGKYVRAFVQLKSGLESFRTGGPRPIDEKKLDFEAAFVEVGTTQRRQLVGLAGRPAGAQLRIGAAGFRSRRPQRTAELRRGKAEGKSWCMADRPVRRSAGPRQAGILQ